MRARRSAKRRVGARSWPVDLAVGVGIAALDVEQHEIDVGEVVVVGARAEEARGVERGVQAHALGGREQPLVKPICTSGSPPEIVRPPPMARSAGAKSPSRRTACASSILRAVLEMPGVGVVAVLAAQQAAAT